MLCRDIIVSSIKGIFVINEKISTGDGISGTFFDRLGFLAMMIEIETGNVE